MKLSTLCSACHARTTARVPTAIMAFLACFMSYSVRLCLNLAIIAMVQPEGGERSGPECATALATNASGFSGNSSSFSAAPDYGERFAWSTTVQGHVKAAYGVGYFVAHFPAGPLADALGARRLVLCAVLAQGLLTALLPSVARLHWGAVYALRLLSGLGGGLVYPALHSLVAHWAPPNEKGKFIFSLMGGTFSAVATWPVVGALVESLGWASAFYYVALTCCAWALAWWALVWDEPQRHPFVSERERSYIERAQAGTVRSRKRPLSLRRLAASLPFYALVVAHYGNLWGLFLLTTDTPVFLSEVLGFSIQQSGFLGSLPSLARCVGSLLFGELVDWVTRRGLWRDRTALRKALVLFSHLLPGAIMTGLAFVGCDVPLAVALLVLGLGFNGASTVTNLVNHHDLAPNYAGTLYGFMNGVGTTTLWIVPSITGAVLEAGNGLQQWKIIYLVGAGWYLFTGLVFIAFGSAEIQSWNNCETEEETRNTETKKEPPSENAPGTTTHF